MIVKDHIECIDGFRISIQASEYHYCTPRFDNAAFYTHYELGFPNKKDKLIAVYAEDKSNLKDTVYPYVPTDIIYKLIKKHGGLK